MLRVRCIEFSLENLILTRTYHFYIVDINTELNIIWMWQPMYETYPAVVIRGKMTPISLHGLWTRSFYQFQFYVLFYGSSCKHYQTKFNRTKTEIYLRASVMLVTWIHDIFQCWWPRWLDPSLISETCLQNRLEKVCLSRLKEDDQVHFCERSISLSNMANVLKHRSECKRRETTIAMKLYYLDAIHNEIDDDVFE